MTEQVLQSIASTLTTLTVLVALLVCVDLGTRAYALYKVVEAKNIIEQAALDNCVRELKNHSNPYWRKQSDGELYTFCRRQNDG